MGSGMLIRIISILFPLFAITALGYWIGRKYRPDMAPINQINMDVFVPALVFSALAGQHVQLGGSAGLVLITLIMVLGSGLVGWALSLPLKTTPRTLVPTTMFNNCGNLGLPLAVLAFGEGALAPAVVMFMVSNLLHFSFGAWLLDHRVRWWSVWKVPSVMATFLGLGAASLPWTIWPPFMHAVGMLGDVSIPLMLFALGVRLSTARASSFAPGLWGALLRPLAGLALAFCPFAFFPRLVGH
jgi:malate permease and related proteins